LRRVLTRRLALRLVLAALPLAVGLAAASASPALANPRICFYVEDRVVIVGSNTGHAFVQLLPDAGPQAGKRDLVYGFYPKHKLLFLTGSAGDIRSDAESGWRWKKCVYVSRADYDKAESRISDDLKDTPRYALLSFNCVDWIFRVAGAAGVTLPDARVPLTQVLDPERLALRLRDEFAQQGGRNIPGGNAVFSQPGNVKPNSTTDAPKIRFWTDSYTDLALSARRVPQSLARQLEMTAHVSSLPAIAPGLGKQLRLSLAIPGRHAAITKIWFGDGTYALQRRTFFHTYRRPGTYRVVGIAIANATVYKFSFRVTVDRRHGRAATLIQVPQDKPNLHRLPPLPPKPIRPLPE
jgi:hypothetical protein